MAEINKIKINDIEYEITDTQARSTLSEMDLQNRGVLSNSANINDPTLPNGIYELNGCKATGLPYSSIYGVLVQLPGDYRPQMVIGGGSGKGKLYTRRYLTASDTWIDWDSPVNDTELTKYATKTYVDTRVPVTTADDDGKFLRVVSGTPTWTTVSNAEEATFGALINFTIEDTLYQAEEGMTWAEWIETTYNIDEYRTSNNNICSNNISGGMVIDSNRNSQKPSDIILNGEAYRLSYTGLEDNPFL